MDKINEFKARKTQIESNTDLSQEGKKKALATLQQQADTYKATAVKELGISWGALRQRMARNIEAVQAAESKAAQQWDYSRLNYMTQAVKSQVASTANFSEVQKLYGQAMQSGDSHARRVWCEVVGEAVKAKYKDGEAVAFTKQLQAELNKVITTPEIETLKSEGSEITQRAAELHTQTQQLNNYFYGESMGPRAVFGVSTEFENIMQGIQVTQRVDPETLTTITTAQLVD